MIRGLTEWYDHLWGADKSHVLPDIEWTDEQQRGDVARELNIPSPKTPSDPEPPSRIRVPRNTGSQYNMSNRVFNSSAA